MSAHDKHYFKKQTIAPYNTKAYFPKLEIGFCKLSQIIE